MLTPAKLQKFSLAIKNYKKTYLDKPLGELDESGTRLLINHFLTDMLGYKTLEEVKTEYMIKGTYADYVIQIGGKRHFLVEVKALSLSLSDKHLRQCINYGANEGIDWVLLTNGSSFEFYKVIFDKPISQELIFRINLSDLQSHKAAADFLQYLHKESVIKGGLEDLWSRHTALSPKTLSRLIYSSETIKFLQKELKKQYGIKFDSLDLESAVKRIARECIQVDEIKSAQKKERKKRQPKATSNLDLDSSSESASEVADK